MEILNNKNKNGFTLIEVIVGLGLGILIIATISSVVFYGLKHIRTVERTEKLHSGAIFLLDNLTYWIKQADNISSFTSDSLRIEFPDSSVKEISKDGNAIKINGVAFTPDDIQVTSLSFTKMTRSVQISFVIKVKGTDETLSTMTTVAQRNTNQ
jgi:type II secretory pathway pseudopilin PulG